MVTPPDPSVRSLVAALLLAVMWGLSIPITKLGLLTLPPLTLTALRFLIAIPLMFVFVAGKQRLPRKALPRVAALGLLGIGIGQVAQTFGVAATSASAGTTISAAIPAFVVVFAAISPYRGCRRSASSPPSSASRWSPRAGTRRPAPPPRPA